MRLDWLSRISRMTSCLQDRDHDVRPPIRRLPARLPSACASVIGSVYAPQFLIYSTFVLVKIKKMV